MKFQHLGEDNDEMLQTMRLHPQLVMAVPAVMAVAHLHVMLGLIFEALIEVYSRTTLQQLDLFRFEVFLLRIAAAAAVVVVVAAAVAA